MKIRLLVVLLLCSFAAAQHTATLNWTNPASTETISGTTLTLNNNNVYRSLDNATWTPICCAGGAYANTPITSFVDTTIVVSTVYYYEVTAVYTLSGGSFSCSSPCESPVTMEVETSIPTAYQVSAGESNTVFNSTSLFPLIGGSDLVGSPLSLGAGSYIIIGTIAGTLKSASTATCWIMELPSTQISPLTYFGSETPAVTTLWLPMTIIASLTIGSTESVQMECTNNAGHPELGPFVLTAIQVSSISN